MVPLIWRSCGGIVQWYVARGHSKGSQGPNAFIAIPVVRAQRRASKRWIVCLSRIDLFIYSPYKTRTFLLT